MKRKIISSLLVIVLFAALAAVPAAAEGMPTICADGSAEAERGDQVTITFSLKNNPGICAFSLSVVYDDTRLALLSLDHAKINGSELWTVNGANATWVSFEDTSFDGVILTAKFKVLDNAPAGEAAVSVSFSKGDIGNFAEEEVDFSVSAAAVTVVGADAESTAEPPQESPAPSPDAGTKNTEEVQNSAEPVISTEKTEEESSAPTATEESGEETPVDAATDDEADVEKADSPAEEEKEAMVNGGGLSARTYLIIALTAVVIAAVVWLILKKRK